MSLQSGNAGGRGKGWHGEQGHGASSRLVELGAFRRRGFEAVAGAMIPEGAVR
jgi:hypothetical protein